MPGEKFLDILPPHKVETDKIERLRPSRPGKFFLNKKLLLGLFLVLIFGLLFLHFKLQKVEIEIWPLTETIRLEKEKVFIQKDSLLSQGNFRLPAVLLELESTDSQKFPASYITQEKRAEGIIRVYNFYSTAPLTLRAQTRFLSDGGKLFRVPKKITIPGKKLEKGKWAPGILDVKVIAAEPGKDYNIPPSKFSLPGLAGTNLYTLVYGKSFEYMRGGFSGKGHQVLSQDIETAEDILLDKIKKANINNLKEKALQEGLVFLEETISHKVLEAVSSEEVGNIVEEFEFRAKVKTEAFAFQKKQLEEIVAKMITSQLEKDKMLWPETLELDWQIEETNLEKGEILLFVNASAKISDKIDKVTLLETLSGKSIQEAIFLLKNQFERAEVKATPFWLRKIPKNPEKIEIKFILD